MDDKINITIIHALLKLNDNEKKYLFNDLMSTIFIGNTKNNDNKWFNIIIIILFILILFIIFYIFYIFSNNNTKYIYKKII